MSKEWPMGFENGNFFIEVDSEEEEAELRKAIDEHGITFNVKDHPEQRIHLTYLTCHHPKDVEARTVLVESTFYGNKVHCALQCTDCPFTRIK